MAVNKLLVAFDESEGADRALAMAASLAAVNPEAHVDVVYVVPIPLLDETQMANFKDILDMMISDGEDLLAEAEQKMGEDVAARTDSLLLTGTNPATEIVKLIGGDMLPDDQKLILEIAKVIRIGFLQQNAFHKDDTCVPMEKQFKMMDLILYLYKKSRSLVSMGMPMSVLKEDPIFDKIISIKYDVPNDRLDMFDDYRKQIDAFYESVIERNA